MLDRPRDNIPEESAEVVYWQAYAEKLADWAAHMMNRQDAWGEYVPLVRRRDDKKSFTAKGKLTHPLLVGHFNGETILGLHSTNPDDETCSWLGLDFDQHGDDDERGSDNAAFVIDLANHLVAEGYDILLSDSNGKGGFHLLVFLPYRLPCAQVHAFGKYLLRNAEQHGLAPVETFPKQPKLTGKRFGNWLRLPGKHHTRDHWSKVWDGKQWFCGERAIEHLLTTNHGSGLSPMDDGGFTAWQQQMELLSQQQRAERANRRAQLNPSQSDDELQTRIRSALMRISPDIDYNEWLLVGMALHNWDSIQGLALWHEWSSPSEKYKAVDLDNKWMGFVSGEITIGTLFHIAKSFGWVPPKRELPQVEIPTDTREPISIDEYRDEMEKNYAESALNAGVKCNTAPTGTGKSYRDEAVILDKSGNPYGDCAPNNRALIVLPTHANCAEVVNDLRISGIDAVAAPALDESTCERFEIAASLLKNGIPVAQALCADCELKHRCVYQERLIESREAPVRIATQKRLEHEGFVNTCLHRQYAAIHEDSTDVLRPMLVARQADFERLVPIIAEATTQFVGQAALEWLRETALRIAKAQAETLKVTRFKPPDTYGCGWKPRTLRGIAKVTKPIHEKALKILIALMNDRGTLTLYDHETKDGAAHRVVALVRRNQPREDMSTVFADATANPKRLRKLLGCDIGDLAPNHRISFMHRTVQVPVDITLGTSPNVAMKRVRGILARHPNKRIGVIGWMKHIDFIISSDPREWESPSGDKQMIQPLPVALQKQITKVAYFGSGDERSSNEWKDQCDLVVVLGTYRQHPDAIRDRLVQWGELDALRAGSDREQYEWIGTTENGKSQVVQTWRYMNHVWQEAYESLSFSALHQCVGRGRGLNNDGIPVLVLSNEPLRLPLADILIEAPELNAGQLLTYSLLWNRAETLINNTIRVSARLAAIIADSVGRSPRSVQTDLKRLEQLGFVTRIGKARATRWHVAFAPGPGEKFCVSTPGSVIIFLNPTDLYSFRGRNRRRREAGAGASMGGSDSLNSETSSRSSGINLKDEYRRTFRAAVDFRELWLQCREQESDVD
jgi:hypothetical protein